MQIRKLACENLYKTDTVYGGEKDAERKDWPTYESAFVSTAKTYILHTHAAKYRMPNVELCCFFSCSFKKTNCKWIILSQQFIGVLLCSHSTLQIEMESIVFPMHWTCWWESTRHRTLNDVCEIRDFFVVAIKYLSKGQRYLFFYFHHKLERIFKLIQHFSTYTAHESLSK